jgi:phosphoglycerate dehydrogenase-like enzyme
MSADDLLLIVDRPESTFAKICEQKLPTTIRCEVSVAPSAAVLAETTIMVGAPNQIATHVSNTPKLKWAQSTWAGVKPLIDHSKRDYCLTGVKGIFGQPMSEYVVGWLLALERQLLDYVSDSQWTVRAPTTVAGKRLGIMGTGDIGRAVAETARALNIEVWGLNRSSEVDPVFQRGFCLDQVNEFAAGLDYLLCLLPDTPATTGLVSNEVLSALPSGAILINAGRGNSVNENALLAALASGQLRYAVLDVFNEEPLPQDHPFWSHPNIFVTSHTSAPTVASDVSRIFLENLQRYLKAMPLLHVVDFDKGY